MESKEPSRAGIVHSGRPFDTVFPRTFLARGICCSRGRDEQRLPPLRLRYCGLLSSLLRSGGMTVFNKNRPRANIPEEVPLPVTSAGPDAARLECYRFGSKSAQRFRICDPA